MPRNFPQALWRVVVVEQSGLFWIEFLHAPGERGHGRLIEHRCDLFPFSQPFAESHLHQTPSDHGFLDRGNAKGS